MSLRLRIFLAFALLALLPALPVTLVVRDLLEGSFRVGLSPALREGLAAGGEAARGWLRAERREFEREVGLLWPAREAIAWGEEAAADLPPEEAPAAPPIAPAADLALLRLEAAGPATALAGDWPPERVAALGESARALAPAGSAAPGAPLYSGEADRGRLEAVLPLGDPVAGWLLVSRALPEALARDFEQVVAAHQLQAGLELERDRLRGGFLRPFIIVYGVALLVSLAAAALLSTRLTRRLAALSAAARRVGAGDWSARVPAAGRDEVARLGSAFNEMAAGLGEQQQRLADLERLAAWREMARSLAHEIKNPLTPISLMVQEMRDRYRGGDAAYAAFLAESGRIVEDEVESLRRLSREFSAFARTPEMHKETADLGALLADLARLYGSGSNAERVELTIDPALPAFAFDPEQLRRVFSNLFENAQAAMAALPAAERRLRVDARAEAGRARVDVVDSGPGVPEALRARGFEPHFSSKAGGMGLGLALVRSVCTLHGGDARLVVDGAPGAHFVVELPLAERTEP
ncbi:HAMP domain-containing protein [bacterium]|nr:HAMP domain-containing protein [bacterium]